MAELVNNRIERMINELEQMQRISLYTPDEIREISRKRREFEYKIQRRVKGKEDYAAYIAYELALLEDISLRRQQMHITEKKGEIERAMTKRLNQLFNVFISRFKNDIEIYFQYIKFCRSVSYIPAISSIIGQMIQMFGDKPKVWQLAGKWELEGQNNPENAREFLLKGIHRHPESEILYLDLFKVEVILAHKVEDETAKDVQLKRAVVVWKNGYKNIDNVNFLFKIFDLAAKFDLNDTILNEIKSIIWSNRDKREVWQYIASKELMECHWTEIEDFIDSESKFPPLLANFMCVYEEALQQFPDETLCRKYIHELLRVHENICSNIQRIYAVKQAWMFGHEHGILSEDMYEFGLEMLKRENELSTDEICKIINDGLTKNPKAKCLWEQKVLLLKSDEKAMDLVLKNASKVLPNDTMISLWNLMLDNIVDPSMLQNLHKRLLNCENVIMLTIKPKLLQKTYQICSLKAARELYNDMIVTPPFQKEVHYIMIDIESSQEKPNIKILRKCYELLVQNAGNKSYQCWLDYINFEVKIGNPVLAPSLHKRAILSLNKEIVDDFIKAYTLEKIN